MKFSKFDAPLPTPMTRANMNEPSMQRTYWRYHCSVT